MTGNSKKAYQVGFKAYKILKKFYSDKPQTIFLFENMLKDMKTGTPFVKE